MITACCVSHSWLSTVRPWILAFSICSDFILCQPGSYPCFLASHTLVHKRAAQRRWVPPRNEMSHLFPSGWLPQHGVNSLLPLVNWVCQCSDTQLSEMLCDVGCLLGERNWHKPHPNGIQKQRSVNEVLIAFIKTLTKELKWQGLPSPTQDPQENMWPQRMF